ncbi:unnamed protein product [Protopolystoma xenopodis]|uniref:BPTI/Kunitz inhibitor domain-containing protein n=1 Tax=Protopolystoma xenopodis TaxID=117903 RepID=A0A3S5BUG8_9PLAT|nr:unnamed protein product [Protopolystoma xenopodis]
MSGFRMVTVAVGGLVYYCPRTHRCRELVYLGCNGNENLFSNYTVCLASCMPEEMEKQEQMMRARSASMLQRDLSQSKEPQKVV